MIKMTFYNIFRTEVIFCHKGTTVISSHKGASVKCKAIEDILTDKGTAVILHRKDTSVILNRKSSIFVSKMDFFFQNWNRMLGSHKLRVKIKQAYAHIQLLQNPKNDKNS